MKSPSNLRPVLAVWKKLNPNPKCELYYKTHYQLLVSVVLSAQATDKSVNQAMTPHYQKGLTPEDVIEMGQAGVLEKIRSIGLAPTKSKNVFNLSKILIEKYSGKVPNSREALESLPGVGRKTANVVLGELFGHPTLAIDTHGFRVGKRLGWHNENNHLKAEQAMLKVIPPSQLPKAHHWLVLHGRYICKARKPLCDQCPIAQHCPSAI